MTFRPRSVCTASIAALVLAFAGCGDDENDAKDDAAKKYCKALQSELQGAADSLEKCVDQVKNLTSKDAEDIERELDKANEQLKNLRETLTQP